MESPKDVLNIQELACYLDISRSTRYKLIRQGKIPGRKAGRHWGFHRTASDSWFGDRSRVAPS